MGLLSPRDAPAWMGFTPAKRDASGLKTLAAMIHADKDAALKNRAIKQKAVDDQIKNMGFDKWADKLDVMSGDKQALLGRLSEIENGYTQIINMSGGDLSTMIQHPYYKNLQRAYNSWIVDANTALESKKQYDALQTDAKEYQNEYVFLGESLEPATDRKGNYITINDFMNQRWFTPNNVDPEGNPTQMNIPDFGLQLSTGADAEKSLGEIFSKAKSSDGTFNWQAIDYLGPQVKAALQQVLDSDPNVKSNAQQLSSALAVIASKVDSKILTGISNEFHKLHGSRTAMEKDIAKGGVDFPTYAQNYIQNIAKTYLSVDQGKAGSGDGSGGAGDKSHYFWDSLVGRPSTQAIERERYYPFKNAAGEDVLRGMPIQTHEVPLDKQDLLIKPGTSLKELGTIRINGNEVNSKDIDGEAIIVGHAGTADWLPMYPDSKTGSYRPPRTMQEFYEATAQTPTGNPTGSPPGFQVQDHYYMLIPEGGLEKIKIYSAMDQAGKAVKNHDEYAKKHNVREIPTKLVEAESSTGDSREPTIEELTEVLETGEAQNMLDAKGIKVDLEGRSFGRFVGRGPRWRLVKVEITRSPTAIYNDPVGVSGQYGNYTDWRYSDATNEFNEWARQTFTFSPEADITNGGQ